MNPLDEAREALIAHRLIDALFEASAVLLDAP